VNDEVIKLKQRIAELERVNAQLTRENAALKGKPQKEAQQTGDKTRAILQFFFETPQSLTTSQVAARFNLTQSAAKYQLDHLVANGFLTVSSAADPRTGGKTTGFRLTPAGRSIIAGGAS
jgi:DNA-binding MarR family transcriptional regulator